MSLLIALVIASSQPLTPIQFGRRELIEALGPQNVNVRLLPQASLGKEAYRIVGDGQTVKVYGGDANGVMYGAMEFAERYRNSQTESMLYISVGPEHRPWRTIKGSPPPSIWSTKASGKPYLADRGLNLFLTLPWDYKKNDTDYSLDALTDPDRWWFHNKDYWTTLLDLMARSRLNWLDIHGAWDISVTNAPNLYAYFVTSKTFPKVGVSDEIKAKNLKLLNHVIEMAHARGIRVSLMAYEANLRIPQNPNPGYEASEANIYTYTKEVVEQMIRRAPKLDALGYRIGESGKGEAFFHCYGEAVKASGRDIPLITRSWITRRQNVLPLARASKDYTVQIKYNGEQWGAPYMVAGGRMANWYSYSFEDYLSDSSGLGVSPKKDRGSGVPPEKGGPELGRDVRATGRAAKLWPGNLVSELGRDVRATGLGRDAQATRWPSNPYKIVWQVRANGTHRIFPFYNPEMVRSTIKTMKIGTATGYTIEGLDAYYPKSPDYYLANPADKYCDWIHQRDEMYWMTWGRLGYDPGVKDEVFERAFTRQFGHPKGPEIARSWAAACGAFMLAFSNYSLGPDHRNHAPELETGGDVWASLEAKPFDSAAFLPTQEEALYRLLGLKDGRIPGGAYGETLGVRQLEGEWNGFDVRKAEMGFVPKAQLGRAREIVRAVEMLTALAGYYANKLDTARQIAGNDTDAGFKRYYNSENMTWFDARWSSLAFSDAAKAYRPFTERLRMRTNTFHWKNLMPAVMQDIENIDKLPTVRNYIHSERHRRISTEVSADVGMGTVQFTVPAQGFRSAALLYKPLPSSTFFHRTVMKRSGDRFVIVLPRPTEGLMYGAELETKAGEKARWPQWPAAPYRIVPALPGPTPQIYSTEEAMTYLDPSILKPDKHAAMLVAPRGMRFHNGFDKATKRKILDPVERGMTLLVMQQDYVSGRYKMDWLPVPLGVENNPQPTVFDPGGAIGLRKIETSDILWQRFKPSQGWEVFGNGGVAHLKWGKGHIWMINARLMQRMTHPDCARALKTLMEFCGSGVPPEKSGLGVSPKKGGVELGRDVRATGKPVVILDPGTEDASFSTSFFPDFMNVLDIPFLTLGEVIAKEQGVNSFTPIPGKVEDDDILQGNGERMVNAFLRSQVVQASKRPTPSNLPDFEKERTRRKAELLRCLGLDPMPPKTPLNARVTGVIQRSGYHIDKVVFESRPRFYVTAHVYVPEPASPFPLHGKVCEPTANWDGVKPQAAESPHLSPARRADPPLAGEDRRYPIVVHVNGHWAHKKGEDRLQLRAAFCALQGYIAVVVDSPGWSFEGNSLIERRAEGSHNDWFMFHGGTNATGYYVWDCIRALDYMSTRPDADMSRIGITGASGGGLATLYTFAADDRYKAAVPVVYMASMELAPDNGCLCNHVPGTSQIGDRSDVIAIQAPKPVLVMGAQSDPEFPPAATLLTVDKMKKTWRLFSGQDRITGRIFDGPHDYNQLMREQMIGFFNQHLKGEGDGSPVPQPPIEILDPEDRQLLALDPAPADERTMRDLSLEYLSSPQNGDAVALSGGKPAVGDLRWTERYVSKTKRHVTFEPEPGLTTPGILLLPDKAPAFTRIYVSDLGKASLVAPLLQKNHRRDGGADLCLDILGTGEFAQLEPRYLMYLGQSVAFKGGWQIAVAANEMKRRYGGFVDVVAKGPLASQAAAWALALSPGTIGATSTSPIRAWEDVLQPGMSPYLVQPRAHLIGILPWYKG